MFCKFCQAECKPLGLSMHERFCKENPNRRTSSSAGAKKGRKPWNIGKTLSEDHKRKIASSLKENPSTGTAKDSKSEIDRRKKISDTMKSNPNAGGLREGSGRGIKTWYDSPIAGRVYLRSTTELEYARYLDGSRIQWKANRDSFVYSFEEKDHRYYPDFYLIDEDCYIEVKGFKTLRDEAKWSQFPHKLKILYGKDIKKLTERYQSGLLDRS